MCKHHKYSGKSEHSYHYKGRWAKMGIGSLFLGALLVMVLWNALVPDLFGGPHLGYWQSFALLFLSRLLFGWGGGPSSCHMKQGSKAGRWREEFEAKMREACEGKPSGMSEAEKETFKEGFTSGKWDVNVEEVEEEKSEEEGDEGDESKPEK